MTLKEIAIQLRTMHLFIHTAHNLVKGPLFFADHEVLGDFYKRIAKDYDSIIEAAIVMEGPEAANLHEQMKGMYKKLKKCTCDEQPENKVWFAKIKEMEEELCDKISKLIESGVSPGIEQLVGDVASRSAKRKYLINQRLS
jgi:DNA-binding ferritin-like protein